MKVRLCFFGLKPSCLNLVFSKFYILTNTVCLSGTFLMRKLLFFGIMQDYVAFA